MRVSAGAGLHGVRDGMRDTVGSVGAAIGYSRGMRFSIWFGLGSKLSIAGAILLSCGGAAPEATSPDGESASGGATDDANSPERRCLLEARAERSPSADAPERIEVSHILVRHAELDDPRGATRSPGQACLRALEALKALEGGASWSEAVSQYSDSKSDSLGRVARDDLSPAFGNAAFALEVEQLSYVVESDRGFHVILRTD